MSAVVRCWLLFAVCCVLFDVCCMLSVGRCWLLFVLSCVLFGVCVLCAVYCLLRVVSCLESCDGCCDFSVVC